MHNRAVFVHNQVFLSIYYSYFQTDKPCLIFFSYLCNMTRKTYINILTLLSLIVSISSTAQDKLSKRATTVNGNNATTLLTVPSEEMPNDTLSQEEEERKEFETADLLALADSMASDSMAREVSFPERAVMKIDNLLKDNMFKTSQVGLMVWDLDRDTLIYAYNEKQLMRPASTMKILTAITALDKLGKNYRYMTSVYATGDCDSTSLCGNIYVKGGMDPSFGSYDMDCFIEDIAKLHIDTIRGKLVADLSFKDSKPFGEGWCWDDKNPTLTPLLYNKTDNFLAILRERLKAQGIVVMGSDSVGVVPSNARLLGERYSSIESILYRTLKDSDNLYAESLLYHLGSGNGRSATAKRAQEAEKEVLRKAGVDKSQYRLADGSGLSLYNYLSAECEVKLLRYAYKNKKYFGTFCQALPSAGVDGTLKRRMTHEPVLDNVRAKTGTLTGIVSLAGYATSPEGNMLAFCIINQSVMSAKSARNFQDRVCMAICK